MGISYWFRAVILCFAFGLCVWAIYSIQQKGLGPNANEMLTGQKNPRIDICETRVKGLKVTSGIELYENGMSWFKKISGQETKLDPVAVEKWFGYNCSVTTENSRPVASNELQAAKPLMIVDFVQGAPLVIKQIETGEFVLKEMAFRSTQFEEALKQLASLREAGPSGRARPNDD